MIYASIQCGVVSKKHTHCFINSSHFVARCIVSIKANMSETLHSDAYTCTCSYYTIHVFFYGILQHLEPSFHVTKA